VANARLEVAKLDNQIGVARTYRFPSLQLNVLEAQLLHKLNFEFPAGVWGVYPATGPIPGAPSSVTTPAHPFTLVTGSLTQPISQQHRIGLGIHLRELERDAAREQYRAARLAVTNGVKKLYYANLQTQSALRANQSALQTLRELDRVVSESVAQQVVLKSDALEVKARIAKAEYEDAALQHGLATQREQLNDLMGRDTRIEFTVRSLPEPSLAPADLAQARTRAAAEHPEILTARLRVREAEQDRNFKKAEYIPDVNFTFQYLSPFHLNPLPRNVAAAGLSLQWDVFDWGRKKKRAGDQGPNRRAGQERADERREPGVVGSGSRYRRVEEARRLLRVVQMAQETAQEKVRIATNRHAERSALLKDLLRRRRRLRSRLPDQQALSAFFSAQSDSTRLWTGCEPMKAQAAKRGADYNKESSAKPTRSLRGWREFRVKQSYLWMAVAAGTVLMTGCRNEEKATTPLTPVTVTVVEQSNGANEVRYSGNIMPRSQVNLAFRIGGYVEKILTTPGSGHLIQEGDEVHRERCSSASGNRIMLPKSRRPARSSPRPH
jgi:outer membrane protein TolC